MYNGHRHVECELAEIKLTENGVMARSDSTSVTGNPFAVNPKLMGDVTSPMADSAEMQPRVHGVDIKQASSDATDMVRALGVSIGARVTWCGGETSGILERVIPPTESIDGEGRVVIRMDDGSSREILASGVGPAGESAHQPPLATPPSAPATPSDEAQTSLPELSEATTAEDANDGGLEPIIEEATEEASEVVDNANLHDLPEDETDAADTEDKASVHDAASTARARFLQASAAALDAPLSLTRPVRATKVPTRLEPAIGATQHADSVERPHPHAGTAHRVTTERSEEPTAAGELHAVMAHIAQLELAATAKGFKEAAFCTFAVDNTYIVGLPLIDVETGDILGRHAIVALINGETFEYDPLDVKGAAGWYTPTS